MAQSLFRQMTCGLVLVSFMAGPGAYASTSIEPPISASDYAASNSVDRAAHQSKVEAFLSQDQVMRSLEQMGVSREDAMRRVSRLSDAELMQLAGDLESAPAGGIVGAIVFVFLVLLLTDILGFTKVYPFTRSIRR